MRLHCYQQGILDAWTPGCTVRILSEEERRRLCGPNLMELVCLQLALDAGGEVVVYERADDARRGA
ncbi:MULTISPECIES: hypothetical protein [Methylorubrum]|uniref:Uncharacterized protein n=1 Tax=Methylorubrum thiocyanatum TaxID=47958 RepID=A0AA40V8G0_9HYPH|nr:hypothetical protein [Methylorubrum thiocyanatum]MBA8910977.1 hypothetical protein [Methylorubrum thiocyanatum]GJE83389.1 hypothetical protein CJNNKLLH_4762 [Methylorubrum thiocyanatum]